MTKLLIFGYSGFVGPYLAKEFLDAGYDVFGSDIVNPSSNISNVVFSKVDLLNEIEVNNLIAKVKPNMIINLAAISSVGLSWKIPKKTFEVNVCGTINILEAIKNNDSNIKLLIVGSSEEYKQKNSPLIEDDELDSNNPYGISKVTQERISKMYAERYGLKIVRVRAFNHSGIGQKDTFVIPSFCKQVAEIEKSGKPGTIYVGNLEAIRDFSDVRDIVHSYRYILENYDNGVFNIGSGVSRKLSDILKTIISFSNQEITVMIDKDKYRPIDTPFIGCKNIIPIKFRDFNTTLKEMFDYYLKN